MPTPRPAGRGVERLIRGSGQGRKVSIQSRLQDRSTRNTPPVPAQLPLIPNEVTPPITSESPMKFGPPESPKQVPPVLALFDSRSE